jgi:hypothetical protein
MQPRIYTYKITFEEIPHWYWGAHKEIKFGEVYLGTPTTHSWMWDFYTPKFQILQFFPYTDEGWEEAQNVENRCIKPDLNNLLCLNEHYGSVISLEACRRGAQIANASMTLEQKLERNRKGAKAAHAERDEFGRSVLGVRCAEKLMERGVGVTARSPEKMSEDGKKSGKAAHAEKDENGKSKLAVKNSKAVHSEKGENGKSKHAMKMGQASARATTFEQKSENGRKGGRNGGRKSRTTKENYSKAGKIGSATTNSQVWYDPDYPELGYHSAPTLSQMQKRRGYPHGPENRVRVE